LSWKSNWQSIASESKSFSFADALRVDGQGWKALRPEQPLIKELRLFGGLHPHRHRAAGLRALHHSGHGAHGPHRTTARAGILDDWGKAALVKEFFMEYRTKFHQEGTHITSITLDRKGKESGNAYFHGGEC
jgi:hypothetical protein